MRERQMEFEDLVIRRALESAEPKPSPQPSPTGSRWWNALKSLGRRPTLRPETVRDRTVE